ncbi:MAG: hypothetical protein IKW19_10720, partial [Akkermansia sp.]|nr:hypothetical protein [Akkermansia sp.]
LGCGTLSHSRQCRHQRNQSEFHLHPNILPLRGFQVKQNVLLHGRMRVTRYTYTRKFGTTKEIALAPRGINW